MKNVLKAFGGLLILLALIVFMYGSIKTSKALEEDEKTVQIMEGIELVEESANTDRAKTSFIIGGVSLMTGCLLLIMGRGRKE